MSKVVKSSTLDNLKSKCKPQNILPTSSPLPEHPQYFLESGELPRAFESLDIIRYLEREKPAQDGSLRLIASLAAMKPI